MSDKYRDIPAMRALRDHLTDVSEQMGPDRLAAAAPRDRRRRRWTIRAVLALALLAAAGAGAATLLSTGEPVEEPAGKARRYAPAPTQRPAVDVTAADPELDVPWAVAVYTSRSGEDCAIAGQLRGNALGVAGADDRFHPYEPTASGPCGDLSTLRIFYDQRHFAGQDRTLIYGRVRRRAREVVLSADGGVHRAQTGHSGAFLFVFEGRINTAGVHVSPANSRTE